MVLYTMKKSSAFAALALALCSTLSCEQQPWEQTKMFNQNRHAEGHSGAHTGATGSASGHGGKGGGQTTIPVDSHGVKPAVH